MSMDRARVCRFGFEMIQLHLECCLFLLADVYETDACVRGMKGLLGDHGRKEGGDRTGGLDGETML